MGKRELLGPYHKSIKVIKKLLPICCLLFLFSCKNDNPAPISKQPSFELAEAPIFNADSAYQFIQTQVDFGPRVPNTLAHQQTASWLIEQLNIYADTLIVQEATLTAFDGTPLEAKNIIAVFNPDAEKRILLSAHWDTRPFADQDKENQEEAIVGANDGASGVAILIEIARLLKKDEINIGVDIILFDAEDYGQPSFSTERFVPDSYCLGSQYWAKNPHISNYKAEFGILLDMVGAANAVFTHEGNSISYANSYLQKVWKIGHQLGYSAYFSYLQTPAITDDHLYVNTLAKIPMIDIIQYDKTTQSGFGYYWHTHQDNINIIDKKTLKAVGQTVLQTVFQENKE